MTTQTPDSIVVTITGNSNSSNFIFSSTNSNIISYAPGNLVVSDASSNVPDTSSNVPDTSSNVPDASSIPQQLSYTSQSFDLLRNNSVNFTAIPSSEYSSDFNINNAIDKTNFVNQWSTLSEGDNLKLTLRFDKHVAIHQIILRQRMMENNSSLFSAVKIPLPGSSNRFIRMNIAEDPVLSPLYKQYHASNSTVTWGLQIPNTITYPTSMPIVKELVLEASGVPMYTGAGGVDPFRNTGLADMQIFGAVVDPSLLNIDISANEAATLSTWPMSTFTGPVPLDIFKYLNVNISGGLESTANPGALKTNNYRAFAPHSHICNSFRTYVVAAFTGVLGLPGAMDASFAQRVDASASDWVTEYLTWRSSTNDLSGAADISLAQLMINMIEMPLYLLSVESAIGLGLAGGAGSKWVGSTFLEPNVTGIRNDLTPILESSVSLASDLNTFIVDNSNLPAIQRLQANMDLLGRPFGTTTFDFFSEQVIALHLKTVFNGVLNTGLTNESRDAITNFNLQNPGIFYTKDLSPLKPEMFDELHFVASVSNIQNTKGQVNVQEWIGSIMPEGYQICTTAVSLQQWMRTVSVNGVPFNETIDGRKILQNISELLTAELELANGRTPDEVTYPFIEFDASNNPDYISKFYRDTVQNAYAAAVNSQRLSYIANSGSTGLLTQQQEAHLLWFINVIYNLHLPIIGNSVFGLDLSSAPVFGSSIEKSFYVMGYYSDGFPYTGIESFIADISAQTPGVNFVGPNNRSLADGRFTFVKDMPLTGPFTTMGGETVTGIIELFNRDRSFNSGS